VPGYSSIFPMCKRGILLINLGSPDSPSITDVRKYLREFLMDGRVMDVPYPIRFAIVHGFILPFRPSTSAKAYRTIWTTNGSPLVAISKSVQQELHKMTGLPVELAMRYQNPTIESALRALIAASVQDVLVVPLFPHYAMSSYESAVERVKQVAAEVTPELRLSVLPPYYDRTEYIGALAESALPYLQEDYDHLLLSFHGIPERHLLKANPGCRGCLEPKDNCEAPEAYDRTCYRRHCIETVKRFTVASGVRSGTFSFAFQSRLGMDAWLKPSTHDEIIRLAETGIQKLLVICPAFTVDCLETIEEIGIRAKKAFLEAGGRQFTLIPCLNNQPTWIDGLARMVSPVSFDVKPLHRVEC
jgi:ferrochelatase